MKQIKAGWRDEGLEEAVAIVSAMPEINGVLERESALLAQNLVSGMMSATHENEVATRANKATKEALCRSFLTGLQGSMEQIVKLRAENSKLEAALHKIEDGRGGNPRKVARDALALSSGERTDG